MKVISKQRNSRMCAICGLDNAYGLQAPFYNMEDGSCMSVFAYKEHHQSYPGRVHGGLITAMLDELGLRAMWAKTLNEEEFGVTMSLTTNFRKPVPYGVPLIAKGVVEHDSHKFVAVKAQIFDETGVLLADGKLNYIKLDPKQIAADASVHEEMPYLREDGVTDISFKEK